MKKYIKISVSIMLVFAIFFIGNKIAFKDMIHTRDYEERNKMELVVDLDSRKEVKEGTIFKFKIKNDSKYTYRLDEAEISIQSIVEEGDATYYPTQVKIDPYTEICEDGTISYFDDLFLKGIKPYKEGYLEFLFPKGLKLDRKHFDLAYVNLDIKGDFTIDLPFLENGYITVNHYGGSFYSFNYEEE